VIASVQATIGIGSLELGIWSGKPYWQGLYLAKLIDTFQKY